MLVIYVIDWSLPVHTMRIDSSQARDACFESQVAELRQLGVGPSRCMKEDPTFETRLFFEIYLAHVLTIGRTRPVTRFFD